MSATCSKQFTISTTANDCPSVPEAPTPGQLTQLEHTFIENLTLNSNSSVAFGPYTYGDYRLIYSSGYLTWFSGVGVCQGLLTGDVVSGGSLANTILINGTAGDGSPLSIPVFGQQCFCNGDPGCTPAAIATLTGMVDNSGGGGTAGSQRTFQCGVGSSQYSTSLAASLASSVDTLSGTMVIAVYREASFAYPQVSRCRVKNYTTDVKPLLVSCVDCPQLIPPASGAYEWAGTFPFRQIAVNIFGDSSVIYYISDVPNVGCPDNPTINHNWLDNCIPWLSYRASEANGGPVGSTGFWELTMWCANDNVLWKGIKSTGSTAVGKYLRDTPTTMCVENLDSVCLESY